MAVLFTGDRVDACDDACVRRLASARGACDAVAARLPGTRVLAVTPARYAAGTFAAYDGWFAAAALDARGEPRRYAQRTEKKAWRQLAALLRAACVPLATPLLLLGFSKGAVVVNQLLAEQADTQDDDDALSSAVAQELAEAAARASALRAAHLLDAGTTGGGAHLTDAALLAALAQRLRAARVRVHLHGTPRQWRDPNRRWLAAEAAACARCVLASLCNGDAACVTAQTLPSTSADAARCSGAAAWATWRWCTTISRASRSRCACTFASWRFSTQASTMRPQMTRPQSRRGAAARCNVCSLCGYTPCASAQVVVVSQLAAKCGANLTASSTSSTPQAPSASASQPATSMEAPTGPTLRMRCARFSVTPR